MFRKHDSSHFDLKKKKNILEVISASRSPKKKFHLMIFVLLTKLKKRVD